jgi:hypothetical protein
MSYETLTPLPIPTRSICHTVANHHAAPANTPTTQKAKTDTNKYAIVDYGASDNYFMPTANGKSKTTLHHPIQVTLPDQSTLQSLHACKLDIPSPKTAKHGYILPGMKNHSLISVAKMSDAGCKVIFS